jgi:hypothetical protein
VTVALGEHPDAAGKAYLGVTFVPLAGDELPRMRSFRFERYQDGDSDDGGRLFQFDWFRR